MPADTARLALLALAWVIYFIGHSALASLGLKHWVARRRPQWMPAYRLVYNGLALVLLVPPAWLTLARPGPWLWEWQGAWAWMANGLAGAALLAVLVSLRYYDGQEFLGLAQWRRRERSVLDQECFRISPLHRFVRHPWYSLGLVLIWTRDMDPARLLGAALITLYFVVGSRLEERKLETYHGSAYQRYRARVPGLIPRPWRYLSAGEAASLVAQAARTEPQRHAGKPAATNAGHA